MNQLVAVVFVEIVLRRGRGHTHSKKQDARERWEVVMYENKRMTGCLLI